VLEARWRTRLAHGVNRLFARPYHRVTVETPLSLPKRGAAILVCNHISGLDPLLLQAVTPRVIVWMMAREYYEIRAMKPFFRAIRAIPVDRSGRDVAATRAAMRALADECILGIFPEGRIAPTRELLPFQTGVAMMAIKTKVPVYPAYIDGTNRGMEMVEAFFTPNEVRLRCGPPIQLATGKGSRPDLDISTEKLRSAVASLAAQKS
jgi:1-acyl-sn-glycerol-3-phosphate acyltransferase